MTNSDKGDVEDNANELVFKGVVFNEMKGAMADRDQIFFRRLIAAAAPSGTYGYNSGGEPMAIPSLTHEGKGTHLFCSITLKRMKILMEHIDTEIRESFSLPL